MPDSHRVSPSVCLVTRAEVNCPLSHRGLGVRDRLGAAGEGEDGEKRG